MAGLPISPSVRGGPQDPFNGTTNGPSIGTTIGPTTTGGGIAGPLDGFGTGTDDPNAQQQTPFAGLGPILEDPDADVFKETDDLVRRQELLATNRWNQDEYYKTVVDGYPWAELTHNTRTDVYTFDLPYGVNSLSIQPIPNKNLDLVNKTSEQILVDFPEADAEPIDDSEEAEQAAEMADRFLAQDAGEQGTNDSVLFDDRVKLALVTASTYVEYWVDPAGGGYVPLQIEAHPQAVSPDQPFIGPDGNTTTDKVLRYVTAPDGGQFTDDPSQAAPQWQPKIRASKWGREHLRVYPEHLPVELADQVVILGYCTIGEAKKRWPTVAKMAPEDLTALCDWTPTRYLVLLPPFQRARWKLTDGKTKNKGGSSDERILFYYHRYIKANPDYPKGADVVVSGIDGGLILDKDTLSADVSVRGDGAGSSPASEPRCREIPVVQITPRGDPYGQDPSGKCYVNLFVGATENNATLGQGYAEALNKILHTPFVTSSVSPISGADVENARSSGDFLKVLDMTQAPKQLDPPKTPADFFNMYDLSDESINSIAVAERADSGADNSKERSGKALQIAVSQNNIGKNSMLTAVNNAYARGCRIKLELAMAKYTTTEQIAYVGEDGANQMMDLHAVDFALIGKVGIKAGTGTGLTADNKVQYLGNLKAERFITDDEAMDAARPSFSKRLGLAPNPFEQYVARVVDTWLEGPPEPKPTDPVDPMTGQPQPWTVQYRAWMTAQQQYEQAQAVYQQQVQAWQAYTQNRAVMAGGPPPITLGPEGQNAQAMTAYQEATLAVQTATMQGQLTGADPSVQPQAPQPPQVPKPWVPFSQRPNDTEPAISAIWTRRLSRVMSSVDYEKHGPEWADVLTRQYTTMRQAAATAGTTPGVAQTAQKPGGTPPTPATKPTQPTQPTAPQPALPAGAR